MDSNGNESDRESKTFFSKARSNSKNSRKLVTLCWRHITVKRRIKRSTSLWRGTKFDDVLILQNVNGFVPQNTLMTIMGPSGCGKTTLLATTSFRIKERVEGHIYINGNRTDANQMLTLSGYVPQHDLTIESLTVFEHMKFMAILKMNRDIAEIERLKKIIGLLNVFGITECSSTCIADLSGGEKKRLSIAVQMLTDPLILFCDEPTTGLDSAGTAVVVKLLKKFSSEGKIVICSIHQPTASVFELFDIILLLASGGRVAYFGPVLDSISYFDRLNLKCPSTYNIAEFMINNVSHSNGDAAQRISRLCDSYSKSRMAAITEERIKAACFDNYLSSDKCNFSSEYKNENDSLIQCFTIKKQNLWIQCIQLIWRSFLDLRKNYLNHLTHVITYLTSATVISLIFSQVTLCSENSIQNIRGYINCIVLETLYMFAYYEFNTFMEERALTLREISNGLYSAEAYYLSKLASKLSQSFTEPLLFVLIIRSISRVFEHLTFLEFAAPFVVISIMSSAYGLMLSCIFENFSVLMVIATGHEIPAYLLAGITYKISSLPPILKSLKYFSIFYYSIEVVTVTEWSNIDDIGKCELLIDVLSQNILYDHSKSLRLAVCNFTSNVPECSRTNKYLVNDTIPLSPLEIISDYGFDTNNYKDDLWILMMFALIFHTITYKIILFKSRKQILAY